jgi:hypothetical protein
MRQRPPTWKLSGLCGLAFVAVMRTANAHAASVPGAGLTLSRTPAAAGCPNEATVAAELRERASARAESSEPLFLDVALDAHGSAFTAEIRVTGRKRGERSLRAEGPTCDALHDVLLVSLSLLLDDDDQAAAPDLLREARPAPTAAAEMPSGWLTAGAAATRALPIGWSGAAYAELAVRFASWDVRLGGVWAPERRVRFAPGDIAVQTWAARAQSCYAFSGRELRLAGCAAALLSTLRGEGEHFSDNGSQRRAWLLLGFGPELRWFPTRALSIGMSGQLSTSAGRQTFVVAGVPGSAYRTEQWVGWLGADIGVRIW